MLPYIHFLWSQHNNIQRFLPGNLVAASVHFSYLLSRVLLSPLFSPGSIEKGNNSVYPVRNCPFHLAFMKFLTDGWQPQAIALGWFPAGY
jgi:hypothetical protein